MTDKDRITPHLKSDKVLSLNDIVHTASVEGRFDGNDAIEPMIMAQATNFGAKKRKNGDPEAVHPADVMMRYHVYDMDPITTLPSMKIESTHDLSEALGKGMFPGSMAINRWIGLCNGKEYEVAAHFMTDFYSEMIEFARKNGKRSQQHEREKENDKTIEDITLEDIIADLKDLRPQLTIFTERNSRGEQKKSIDALKTRQNGFQKKVGQSDLSESDKGRYYHHLREYSENVRLVRGNFIPSSTVNEMASLYFERLIERLNDLREDPRIKNLKTEDSKMAPFDKERSVAYHFAREATYSLYIDEIVGFTKGSQRSRHITHLLGEMRNAKDLEFTVFDLLFAKVSDRKDNIRKPKGDTRVDIALDYMKTMMLIDSSEKVLRNYDGDQKAPRYQNLSKAVDSLKHELILTIVTNYGSLRLKADSSYKQTVELVEQQFYDASDRFEKKFMKGFRILLSKAPWKVAIERERANDNLPNYNRLLKLYKTERPQTPFELRPYLTRVSGGLL